MGSNRTVQQSPAGTCFLVSSLDNEVFTCKSVLQIVCGHSAALTPTIEVHLKRGDCVGDVRPRLVTILPLMEYAPLRKSRNMALKYVMLP